jgi:ABC-type glycerol-3-phosphate transport system substrate-binding protein
MSKFQAIVFGFFVLCIVGGVIAFATYKGKQDTNVLPPITIWGTLPEDTINTLVQQLNLTRSQALNITYVQVPGEVFYQKFIEALAGGRGPDLVLVPHTQLAVLSDKLLPVPYTTLSQRMFKDTFIEEAEMYLAPQGVVAVPFTVDPLVMYWNREVFRNAGIASYPRTWDEYTKLVPAFTVKDENANIRRTALPFGEYTNVRHAAEIIGTLMMQSGAPITVRNVGDNTGPYALGGLQPAFGEQQYTVGSAQALTFYTGFADPNNPLYTWNRSLPESRTAFLGGLAATYLGFASEIQELRLKNPNLNFDIASLPQLRNSTNRINYGAMTGLSIVRSSAQAAAAYQIMSILTSAEAQQKLMDITYLPPVRRDVIAAGNTDPYLANFYVAALTSRGWLDPNPAQTGRIFQSMVEGITSGRETPAEALNRGSGEMRVVIQGAGL